MNLFGYELRRKPSAYDMVADATSKRSKARMDPYAFQLGGYDEVHRSPIRGVHVTEERAMRIAAVYACVRVLAESVSTLPLKLYRRDGRTREPAREHPLYRVVSTDWNDVMPSVVGRELKMVQALLWGNAYFEKQMDGGGNVVALWPLHPSRVTPKLRSSANGGMRLEYEVWQADGPTRVVPQERMFHVPGLGFNGVQGKSPIRMFADSIAVTIAAETYGANFYNNDARTGLLLVTDNQLKEEEFEQLKKEWDSYTGPDQAFRPRILEGGLKPHTVGLPPGEAQFIETRKMQRSEIASIYRVPPHMIGDLERATFSNIEHQSIEFVVHSLRPWLVRVEQAMARALLRPEERGDYFFKHSVDGLLRGDTQSRYDAYTKGRNWGWLSANDVRELEDLNPIDGGDEYLQPLNMVPAGTDTMTGGRGVRSGGDGSARGLPVDVTVTPRRGLLSDASLPGVEARSTARTRVAASFEPVYRSVLERLVASEVEDIRDAIARYLPADEQGFRDWLVDWSEEHAREVSASMMPSFQAMLEAMVASAVDELGTDLSAEDLAQFAADYGVGFGNRFAGSARGQLLGLLDDAAADEDRAEIIERRLSEWETDDDDSPGRANKEARRERHRSSNAFTKAAWALAGVSTLTWRAVGESCPFCEELDGRTVAMTQRFVTEGGQVLSMTVKGDVGHPPLHDGCDCIIVPGSGRALFAPAELRELQRQLLEHHDVAACPGDHADRARPVPTEVGERYAARNEYIRGEYDRRVRRGREYRDLVITDLQAGEVDGVPYALSERQIRRIIDGT